MSRYRVLLPQLSRHPRGAGKRSRLRGLVRSGDKGFSLIETLVAIALFAIIASFMAQTMASGLRGVLLGKRREVATLEANRVLEVVRSVDFDDIGLVVDDPTIPGDASIVSQLDVLGYDINSTTWEPLVFVTSPPSEFDPHIQELSRGASDLTRRVYVTDAGDQLKRVLVHVSWRDDGTQGPENVVRVQTLVNENGIVDSHAPLSTDTLATGGSLSITSALLGLGTPLNLTLPTSRGSSIFDTISSASCNTTSTRLTGLIDVPGYAVTTIADDDPQTSTPPNPAPASNGGILTIPAGPVRTLLGNTISSPVACEASTNPLGQEAGEASALSALGAKANVPLLNLLGLPIVPPWVLNLASVAEAQALPVSQEIGHEILSGAREVSAKADVSGGAVNILQIAGVIPDGLVRVDAMTYGASVSARDPAAGDPSKDPNVTSPVYNVRVFDPNQVTPCSGTLVPGVTAARNASYCVLTVNPAAAGFAGYSLPVITQPFQQGLGLLKPVVSLEYSVQLDILPPTKSPDTGVPFGNGAHRWSAEYTPVSASASLKATLLGNEIINTQVGLDLGTVRAKACAGATTCV